jgi:hypothetical protein
VRLPKDPENWTGNHADQLVDRAWREYQRYEARINFDLPQEQQDAIYEPYRQARAAAVEVARYTNWRHREAEMLP